MDALTLILFLTTFVYCVTYIWYHSLSAGKEAIKIWLKDSTWKWMLFLDFICLALNLI